MNCWLTNVILLVIDYNQIFAKEKFSNIYEEQRVYVYDIYLYETIIFKPRPLKKYFASNLHVI